MPDCGPTETFATVVSGGSRGCAHGRNAGDGERNCSDDPAIL